MMVTGSTNAYPTMETAERAASAEVIGMATARSNAARESLAQSEADAVASLSPCEHHFILHKTTVALGEAAAASIKAQDAAAHASARYEKALAAADAHHARFRALRDAPAHECAAAAACARAHAGQQPRCFPNGLVGYDCDPKVGDIDRFFVRLFAGEGARSSSCGYVCCLTDVNDQNTIAEVTAKIQEREGIPASQLRLIWKGQKLRNSQTLSSYGIVDNDSDWLIHGVLIPETLGQYQRRRMLHAKDGGSEASCRGSQQGHEDLA